MSDILNDLMQSVESALEAKDELQQFTNYGKLEVEIEYVQWVNKQPTLVDAATYRDLPAGQKQMNVVIRIDLQEFRPELPFRYYDRTVKFCGKDWYDIVQPSLKEVFVLEGDGDGLTRQAAQKLFESNGKYVFVNDTPNRGGKTYNGKVLKVPALQRVFESREEMLEAVRERFGELPRGVASEGTPKTYGDDKVSAVNTLKESMTAEQIAANIEGLGVSDVKAILGE